MSARDQIIETTCSLLELQGYHATGLNQIISESGSPKGSLYHYFPGGKEELTAESLNRVGRVVLERIRGYLATEPDAAQAVSGFIRNVAENVELSGYKAGGPITTVALETAATSERLRQECYQIYEGWQYAFRDRLIAGGFTAERAERLSALIISALEGGIILCRVRRSPEPLRNVADEIGRLVASG
jgi:TetR/AcrR family transcriptional regulator, lmrAB and yxaGH operons repressor